MKSAIAAACAIPAMLVFLAAPAKAAAGCGVASWYALTSKTASGERMDPAKLTAAHKSLPFGTKLKVTNPKNGKSVVVRINDRGPFTKGRTLDLSKAAAQRIGLISRGHGKVCWAKAA
jgi:rare lipoprotein A